MNTVVLFFSGTGNTEWVATQIAERARNRGDSVALHGLESDIPGDLSAIDCIILAHPIYGANLPRIVRDRLCGIVFDQRVRFIVVTTFGYVNGLGYFAEKRILNKRIDAYYNVRMFNNVTTPSVRGDICPIEERLLRRNDIEARIDSIVESISKREHRIEGIAPYIVAGLLIRAASSRGLKENYKKLSVDLDRCNDCRQCVRNCPTISVQMRDGHIVFGPTCTACMRCYNFCKKSAILIDGKYADPKEFRRYTGPWTEPNYA